MANQKIKEGEIYLNGYKIASETPILPKSAFHKNRSNPA